MSQRTVSSQWSACDGYCDAKSHVAKIQWLIGRTVELHQSLILLAWLYRF
jgi:hypothetical protein